MKKLLYVLLGLLVCAAAVSLVQLVSVHRAYQAAEEAYAAIARTAVVQKEQPAVSQQPEQQDEPDTLSWQVDFDALRAINPHVTAWIKDDTGALDYPVVRGEDNTYYLDHLFDRSYDPNGTIFMDVRSSPGFIDRNSLLHGHNMQNGAMFAPLLRYREPGYYEDHPTLELATPQGAYVLEVFGGYLTESGSDAYQIRFKSDGSYADYLAKIRERSEFDAPVEMTAQDRMVTLSTCAYEPGGTHYVLHCRLTEAG